MKQTTGKQKTVRPTAVVSEQETAAVTQGAALTPPASGVAAVDSQPVQRMVNGQPENRTGLPDRLKAGVEALSGMSLDAVRVHYNSASPAQLQALAYTQGTEIHVGPGQQRHLPHEAWHVVQQAQGCVKPTMQMKGGVSVNDDERLEHEANMMGLKAVANTNLGQALRVQSTAQSQRSPSFSGLRAQSMPAVLQRMRKGKIKNHQTIPGDHLVEILKEQNMKYQVRYEGKPYWIDRSSVTIINADIISADAPYQGASSKQEGIVDTPLVQNGATVRPDPKPFSTISTAPTKQNPEKGRAVSNQTGIDYRKEREKLKTIVQTEGQVIGGHTSWTRDARAGKMQLTAQQRKHSDFGKLSVDEYKFTDTGLEFDATITSNPNLIWEQGDLISVTLMPETLKLHLGDIRMFQDANCVVMKAEYSFEELARAANVQLKTQGAERRNELAAKVPQLGVLAMWRTKEGKGEQHRSGGIDQKGGSGLINVLTEVSVAQYGKTETFGGMGIRNTGWNEGELLKPDRPIFKKFPNLLKLEKQMATTLEAESEYMLTANQFRSVLAAMKRLEEMSAETLQNEYGIVSEVTGEVKEYVDTYYDLAAENNLNAFPLLESDIVFRRRSVATDPDDTNLIAVKGRSQKSTDQSEAIRLAAQIDAAIDFLDAERQTEIAEFLRAEEDNAFGRVLRDALKSKGRQDILDGKFNVKKALTVRSKRTKYKIWLANSTMIDFSADEAFGSTDRIEENATNVVYSFEFGVGHPGLVAMSSGASGLQEEDPNLAKFDKLNQKAVKDIQISQHQSARGALIHRPYHVPKDLENQNLFAKADFKQYQQLRNVIIDKLFGLTRNELPKGGNKAKLLAIKMGIIGENT